jgi:hypothetical protein
MKTETKKKIEKILTYATLAICCFVIAITIECISLMDKFTSLSLSTLADSYYNLTIDNYTSGTQFLIRTNYITAVSSFGVFIIIAQLMLCYTGLFIPAYFIYNIIKELKKKHE